MSLLECYEQTRIRSTRPEDNLLALSPLSETNMISSVVKEASGLSTVKSTLYMQLKKADKDSVFQCTVEYSMPGDQIKEKKSDPITLNLNCEWTDETF